MSKTKKRQTIVQPNLWIWKNKFIDFVNTRYKQISLFIYFYWTIHLNKDVTSLIFAQITYII